MANDVIRINVMNGVAELDGEPPAGVDVHFYDYDIEDCEEDDITQDEDGEQCCVMQYWGNQRK